MPNVLFPKAAVACDLPRGIEFQICTSSDEPPDGHDWLHQIKHDGWRVFVTISERGELRIDSRNGYDYTDKFALPSGAYGADRTRPRHARADRRAVHYRLAVRERQGEVRVISVVHGAGEREDGGIAL